MIVAVLLLLWLDFTVGQVYQRHHWAHNNSMNHLLWLLKSATHVAELATGWEDKSGKNRTIFFSQGNIYDVEDEVLFYMKVARRPGIETICETGFNAGHSAITFLFANPRATYIGFDLGDMQWSSASVGYVKAVFGDRFIYHKGKSVNTLNPEHMGGRRCDLLSVDANHHESYTDFKLGKEVSRANAYILADDFSSDCPLVPRDWGRAVNEGWIRTLEAHKDAFKIQDDEGGYWKGWVLGQYT